MSQMQTGFKLNVSCTRLYASINTSIRSYDTRKSYPWYENYLDDSYAMAREHRFAFCFVCVTLGHASAPLTTIFPRKHVHIYIYATGRAFEHSRCEKGKLF